MQKSKIVELYYFSCADKLWKYSEHSRNWDGSLMSCPI